MQSRPYFDSISNLNVCLEFCEVTFETVYISYEPVNNCNSELFLIQCNVLLVKFDMNEFRKLEHNIKTIGTWYKLKE